MLIPKCALVRAAITHVTKQHRGASLVQVRKHLEATYDEKLDSRKKKLIHTTFKTLIQKGKLLQKGTIYKATKARAIARTDVSQRRYRGRPRRSRRRSPRHRRRRLHHHCRRHHHRRRHHRRRHHKRHHSRRHNHGHLHCSRHRRRHVRKKRPAKQTSWRECFSGSLNGHACPQHRYLKTQQ